MLLSNEHLRRFGVEGVRKLDHLWSGPFTVTEKVGQTSYRLALPQDMRLHNVFHVSLLKDYKESEEFNPRARPRSTTYVPKQAESHWYIVEKFVDSKQQKIGKNLVQMYKVQWKNYPASENTWERCTFLRNDLGKTTYDAMVRELRTTNAETTS